MLTYSLHIVFGLLLCGLCRAFLEDCPHPCTQGGQKYCHPIPCPLPPCNNSVTPPGVCCPECPKPDCPHPCTQGGKQYCHPIPCPKPPCDNPVTPVGACCAECIKRKFRFLILWTKFKIRTETMHCEHRRSWHGIATLLFFFNFVLTYLFSVKIRPPFFYFVLTYLFSVKILYYCISFSLI
jgi:hypothetical protein